MKRVVLLVLAGWCAASCVRPPSSPDDVKEHAIERVTSLSTYRVTIEAEMFLGAMSRMIDAPAAPAAPDAGPHDVMTMKATTTLAAWLPDRMRSTVVLNNPVSDDPVRFELVYDGATVWMTAWAGTTPQHRRVDQRLAVPGRPFDVGFNMRGGGLLEGEDLRGTILWILNMWTFTSATRTKLGDRPCTQLQGTLDLERAVDVTLGEKGEKVATLLAAENREAFALQRDMLAGMMGRGLAELRVATVCVSSDGDVVGWSFGDGTSLLQRVTVTSFERNPTIAIETFSVPDATKSAAVDVSDTVRQVRAAAPVDPKELAAFRSAVLAAVASAAAPVVNAPAAPAAK